MFAKTFRSAVSLALVFCLLLSLSGNVLAATIPGNANMGAIDSKVNGTIAELEQYIADLEKEIADREQQIADGEAQLESGKGQLDDAQNKLDDAYGKLDEAQAKLDAARTQLDEAWAECERIEKVEIPAKLQELADAMADLDAKEADLDVKEAELDAAIADLNAAIANLNAAIEALAPYQDLEDAPAELVQAYLDAVANKEAAEAARQQAYEYKELAAEARAAAAQARIDAENMKNEKLAKFEEAKATLAHAEEVFASVQNYVNELRADVDGYQKQVIDIRAQVEAAEKKLPEAKAAIEQAYKTIADAKAVVANLKKSYADFKAAVTNPTLSVEYIKDTYNTLQADRNELWNSVLALEASVDELITVYKSLEGFSIDKIVIADYDRDAFPYDSVHYEHEGKVYGMNGGVIEAIHVEGYTYDGFTAPAMPEELTTMDSLLDNIIGKVNTLDNMIHYYSALAEKAVEKVAGKLNITINTSKVLSYKASVKVYNWLLNNPDKVCGIAKEYGPHGLALVAEYGPYAIDLIQKWDAEVVAAMGIIGLGVFAVGSYFEDEIGTAVNYIATFKDEVAAVVAKLYNRFGDNAKALIDVYVDYLGLDEIYGDALSADYIIDKNSKYVALGDSTELEETYVEKLAEALGVPYENLTETGVSLQDVVDGNVELLADADLISIGFNANNYIANMVDRMTAYEPVEFDWAKLVGEKYAPKVENAIAKINAELTAKGLDELVYEGSIYTTADALTVAIEGYVYDYVTYLKNAYKAVDNIHAVNPEALVVLVGMYNPFEGVVLNNNGKTVALGTIYDSLIEAMDGYHFVYALVRDNTIFVNAPAVETSYAPGEYDAVDYITEVLTGGIEAMMPTDAGHEYIKDQILNALNVKLLGDVNGDGLVDSDDACLILCYDAEKIGADGLDLSVGDVTGDGLVDSDDAYGVLMFDAELIDGLPMN